ncbi:hypothetical protein HHI36_022177 [Cryptolaemus montrouzieri]|uniref:Serine protease gd N-terminal domain-containing protein n=1 Tax=Cryptolaemus montrouzieri TaxID=559131 RepID=A0ABD2MZB0_9CUCU
MVVDAWDFNERKTLDKAWNRALNRENDNSITNTDNSTLEDMNEVMSKLQICQDCDDDDDIEEWVTCDSIDQGFQIMPDDEMVENISQINEQQEMQEDKTEENIDVENDPGPSNDVAFHTLETALKWFEKQTETDTFVIINLKVKTRGGCARKEYLKMSTNILYFSLLAILTKNVYSQSISPCPELFKYYPEKSQPGKWFGKVTLTHDRELHGVWLRLKFNKPLISLENRFGKIKSDDHIEFRLSDKNFNLKPNTPKEISLSVNYNEKDAPPELVRIILNGYVICPVDGLASLTTVVPSLGESITNNSLSPSTEGSLRYDKESIEYKQDD